MTNSNLYVIWGSSASDVWATGSNGVNLHWDDRIWVGVKRGTDKHLHGVFGAGSQMWIVGVYGTILELGPRKRS